MIKGIQSKEVIKNYTNSILAKSEKNDCSVRALSVFYNISYDEAHKIAESYGRKNKGGMFTYQIRKILRTPINRFVGKRIHEEEIKYEGSPTFRAKYITSPSVPIIVKIMVEKFPIGTYFVFIKSHVFVLKDGVIIGNEEDIKRMRVKVLDLWKLEELD
jgi:hypothetical protein